MRRCDALTATLTQHFFEAQQIDGANRLDLVSCAQVIQIAAHARWVNAIEVHPDGALFASASEDTTVQLWHMSDGPKATHFATIPVTDSLLTGLAFCGGFDRSHVCTNAYDQAFLHTYKLD